MDLTARAAGAARPGTAICEAVFLGPAGSCSSATAATTPGYHHRGDCGTRRPIPVSTIAFGTPDGTVTIGGQTNPVPADYSALRDLADDNGGRPYTVANLAQLRCAFRDRAGVRTTSIHRNEVTSWLVGIALTLILLAVTALLVWTPALP